MTSGKKFSQREIAYVKAHLTEKYPAIIARHLGIHFYEDNGGFRGTKAVSLLISKLKKDQETKGTQPIPISEPASV